MGRRWAREIALQVLFQVDLVDAEPYSALDYLLKEHTVPDDTAVFIRSLVKGTLEHLFEIDDYIERYAIEWDLSRMANVDRNILRMGLYEMLYCQGTPLNVAINEALELAKTFSHEEAPRFINGILGKIAEEMNGDPGNTI
ncbi:MAG TPA: transcription antitermination factor NusB [Syntrophaceticus sp.]|nr:transcription antitermination factor NusB [Syntrophaceticus sp.]